MTPKESNSDYFYGDFFDSPFSSKKSTTNMYVDIGWLWTTSNDLMFSSDLFRYWT